MSSFDSTSGALEIGNLIAGILLGLLAAQVYTYYKTCWKKDPRWLRGLVMIIWLLELTVTILGFHALYIMTITNFGNPEAVDIAPVTLTLTPIMQQPVITMTQGFFVYRIYKVTRRLVIPFVVSLLLLLRIVSTVGVQVIIALQMRDHDILRYVSRFYWVTITQNALGLAADIMIASTLLYHLWVQRSTAHKQTIPVVDKLILYAFETGLVTSLFTISMASCLLAMKGNFIWIGIFLISSKVFSNTLLANLNSRAELRDRSMHDAVEATRNDISFATRHSFPEEPLETESPTDSVSHDVQFDHHPLDTFKTTPKNSPRVRIASLEAVVA